jgi:hypothetical protein
MILLLMSQVYEVGNQEQVILLFRKGMDTKYSRPQLEQETSNLLSKVLCLTCLIVSSVIFRAA